MRLRDPRKEEALVRATIQLVNEIGFAASSVSKIAKAANVSPATIYTYFENKDDLIIRTYQDIMERMSENFFSELDKDLPIKDALHGIWKNMYHYISKNREAYLFTEQFSKSPYIMKIDMETHKRFFAPLADVIRRGIEQKLLKDEHFHMHALFFYYPILALANPNSCHTVTLEDQVIETAFQFAWDSIRR